MTMPQYLTSHEEALDILSKGEYGVLCIASADGQPYGVPLNYCYDSEKGCIYFHCAKDGEKLNLLAQNEKAAFVAVASQELVPKKLDTSYESVFVTGRAAVVQDDDEILHALILLCKQLSPQMADKVASMNCMARVCIVRMSIDEISGKRKKVQ